MRKKTTRPALSGEQRRLIQLVWDELVRNHTWPVRADLQWKLDVGHIPLDLKLIAASLPQEFLHIDRYSLDGEMRLTARGVLECERIDDFPEHMWAFIQLCFDHYGSSPKTPMTRVEFAGRLGLDKVIVARLYKVMKEEHWLYAGGSESADEWTWSFNPESVREIRYVRTLHEYLSKVAELDAANRGVAANQRHSRLIGVLSWLRGPVERGVADTVAQVVKWTLLAVIVVIVGLLGWQKLLPFMRP